MESEVKRRGAVRPSVIDILAKKLGVTIEQLAMMSGTSKVQLQHAIAPGTTDKTETLYLLLKTMRGAGIYAAIYTQKPDRGVSYKTGEGYWIQILDWPGRTENRTIIRRHDKKAAVVEVPADRPSVVARIKQLMGVTNAELAAKSGVFIGQINHYTAPSTSNKRELARMLAKLLKQLGVYAAIYTRKPDRGEAYLTGDGYWCQFIDWEGRDRLLAEVRGVEEAG
jgi:transcriptional regulator with XRE-family HTH domain